MALMNQECMGMVVVAGSAEQTVAGPIPWGGWTGKIGGAPTVAAHGVMCVLK